jgi:hypothetical protein
MKKESFIPYKELILETIGRCKTTEKLNICRDMVDHFQSRFFLMVTIQELNDAVADLYDALQLRLEAINILN